MRTLEDKLKGDLTFEKREAWEKAFNLISKGMTSEMRKVHNEQNQQTYEYF